MENWTKGGKEEQYPFLVRDDQYGDLATFEKLKLHWQIFQGLCVENRSEVDQKYSPGES